MIEVRENQSIGLFKHGNQGDETQTWNTGFRAVLGLAEFCSEDEVIRDPQ